MRRWDRIAACLRAGLDDETIARACGISQEDAALYRRYLDKRDRIAARPMDAIDLMLRDLGLTRCEAYYLIRRYGKNHRGGRMRPPPVAGKGRTSPMSKGARRRKRRATIAN